MSGGYADRLKHYPNKGVCGLPEQLDTERQLTVKLQAIAKRVSEAKHLVVFTGAGISTSAGIPDFRGPSGIWTKQQAKEKAAAKEKAKARKRARGASSPGGKSSETPKTESGESSTQVDFGSAQPTYTHRALVELQRLGHLKFLITQNVDGLDQRAGFPRSHMAVLHGCIFEEKCEACGAIHLRDTAVDRISCAPTGRSCPAPAAGSLAPPPRVPPLLSRGGDLGSEDGPLAPSRSSSGFASCSTVDEPSKAEQSDAGAAATNAESAGGSSSDGGAVCGGVLRDTLLDWEDPLPEDELEQSEAHCGEADLVLALGTSLRIEPAGSLPTLARSFILVNLQQTPKDEEASLIVRAPVDVVMRAIMRDGLGLDFV